MKANIALALHKKVPLVLLGLLNNVIQKLTGNTKLANPPVALSTMQKKADAYATAIEEAQGGSKLNKEIRNGLTREVRDLLTMTANYVRATANGDAALLASSGFDMARTPSPIGLPASPENLKVTMGPLSGEATIRWKRSRGAGSYQLMRSDTDPTVNANWKVVTTTSKVSFTDTGLVSFKPYWYCVSAIGFAGEGQPCQWLMGRAA